MNRTMKRVVIACVAMIAIACLAAAFVVFGSCSTASSKSKSSSSTPASSATTDPRNAAINAVVDATGVKDRIDGALRDNASVISENTGIPESMVNTAIDDLSIPEWQVTTLPSSATETGSHQFEYEGATIDVTTYDVPDVVTVGAFGQEVTMEVPDSAEPYLGFIQYLP